MTTERKTIPTVAFGALEPNAVCVFLMSIQQRVQIFTGKPLRFPPGKSRQNVVLLPNFSQRDQLLPYADQIDRLVVFTGDQHGAVLEHGIPILDSQVENGVLMARPAATPEYYIDCVQNKAVDLALTLPAASPPQPKKAKSPTNLDEWFDWVDAAAQIPEGVGIDFTQHVEYPVCQYLVGILSARDLFAALKYVVDAGAQESVLKLLYTWLIRKDYSTNMVEAMKAYLHPKSEQTAPSKERAAQSHHVDVQDIEVLAYIYKKMQGESNE